MGYCITVTNSDFNLPAEKKQEAFKFAHKKLLDEVNEKGRGGSWSGGACQEKWYSWVDNKILREAKTIEDLFDSFCWDIDVDENGNIINPSYDNKIGQEICLFEAIAQWVDDGSYIQVSGEDGSVWRWVFKNGEVKEVEAKFVFDED